MPAGTQLSCHGTITLIMLASNRTLSANASPMQRVMSHSKHEFDKMQQQKDGTHHQGLLVSKSASLSVSAMEKPHGQTMFQSQSASTRASWDVLKDGPAPPPPLHCHAKASVS